MPKLSKADQKRRISQTEANRRKSVALAKLRELELAVKQGEFARIDDMATQWGEMVTSARTRLLGIGHKLAPVIAVESDAVNCQALIDAEVHEALIELSKYQASPPRKNKRRGLVFQGQQ